MIEVPIVVYTHTDMKDVWPVFFGELQNYLPNSKIYVAVNKKDKNLSSYTQILYNDKKMYTDRCLEILKKINEEIILFIHEDMILTGYPRIDLINKYFTYVKEDILDSIKLIYGGNTFVKFEYDNTLVKNHYSKFSIQPTLIKKENFIRLLNKVSSKNIWDFEKSVPLDRKDYMVKLGGEKKRGNVHYDSIVFPYIATAINKGKWNLKEYQKELDILFKKYNINPFERGIV